MGGKKLRCIVYKIFCTCLFVVGICLSISSLQIANKITILISDHESFWHIIGYGVLIIFMGTYGIFMAGIGFVLLFDNDNERIG